MTIKRIAIFLLVVLLALACVIFTAPLFINQSMNFGLGGGGNSDGDTTPIPSVWLNACTSEAQEQVTQLVETGQPVPNAWMFLDKNEAEVATGDLWSIEIPTGVYGQVFIPATGMTYELRGPGRIRVGAATFWCNDTGDTVNHGNMRLLDAQHLPNPIGQWVDINLP